MPIVPPVKTRQTNKGLSRPAFRSLIASDLAWLRRQENIAARDHIAAILERSEALYYPDLDASTEPPPEWPQVPSAALGACLSTVAEAAAASRRSAARRQTFARDGVPGYSNVKPMPIAYERDDQRRLITVTVTEPYSPDEVLGVIGRQEAEGTWGHAMLYDLRSVTRPATDADLRQMADRVKVIGGGRERGPVGIAIRPQPALFLVFLTYTRSVEDLVSLEVLLTAAQIDAWLARNSRVDSSRQP